MIRAMNTSITKANVIHAILSVLIASVQEETNVLAVFTPVKLPEMKMESLPLANVLRVCTLVMTTELSDVLIAILTAKCVPDVRLTVSLVTKALMDNHYNSTTNLMDRVVVLKDS